MAARAGSGGGGAENFPDLHHKMSKKIAQLTKVIYHLNTRNDDHEQEMAALAAQHEGEINGILRDAASKINKFKDALSKQREAAKEATTVRMLQERHEQEKADVLARFEDFKRTVKDRERATATEHAARLRELKRGFDDAKERFRERMQEFERTSRDLAANSSISSDELDRLKRNHQEEIEDLVRKYNKQYNDMLAQRMEEEDKMRAELEAENKAACENLSKQFESRLKKYKADSEAARAQLKAASDAAMLRAIDEHKVRGLPAAPKLQRAHPAPRCDGVGVLQAAMSRVLEDLDDAKRQGIMHRQECGRLKDANGKLETRVEELERRLRETSSSLDSLRDASGKGEQELRGLLADKDDKIGLLEGQLSMMEGANSQLGQDVRAPPPPGGSPSSAAVLYSPSSCTQLTAARKRADDLQRSLDATSEANSVSIQCSPCM